MRRVVNVSLASERLVGSAGTGLWREEICSRLRAAEGTEKMAERFKEQVDEIKPLSYT